MTSVEHVVAAGVPVSVVRPAGAPRGAVIVIQEAFGVTSHIEDVAGRAAEAGYLAVAPHLFHRQGDPVLDYDDIPAVRPVMAALTRPGIEADLDATLGWLDSEGFAVPFVGIVGFCMGGSVSFYVAATRALGAAVSFYGGGVTDGRLGYPPMVELAAGLQTPWLGLYGERDSGIPMDQVATLRTAVEAVATPTELVTYPGAEHGFHCDDRPAVFDAAAAADAWDRTLSWFGQHLAGR
ncbi:MAG TPA: dienelactone hydrolase family protein [Mycobacteriales bacterium]|jgi:carboxymethylenebutenolidase|nr:dienelactone hydrolase family protein [Mycobacteriales bacterium]